MFLFFKKLLRIPHWVKNTLVFVVVTSPDFRFNQNLLIAFALLCLLSSAGYIVNDYIDKERDSLNSKKHNRFKFKTSNDRKIAFLTFFILISMSTIFTLFTNNQMQIAALLFFGLSIAYSFKLKYVRYLDLVAINILYLLRISFGYIATNTSLPILFVLSTAPFFLFLLTTKRILDGDSRKLPSNIKSYGTLDLPALTKINKIALSLTVVFYLSHTLLNLILQNSQLSFKYYIFVLFSLLFTFRVNFILKNKVEKEEFISLFFNDRLLLLTFCSIPLLIILKKLVI